MTVTVFKHNFRIYGRKLITSYTQLVAGSVCTCRKKPEGIIIWYIGLSTDTLSREISLVVSFLKKRISKQSCAIV